VAKPSVRAVGMWTEQLDVGREGGTTLFGTVPQHSTLPNSFRSSIPLHDSQGRRGWIPSLALTFALPHC